MPKHNTDGEQNTHTTHTLTVECTKQLQHTVVVARSSTQSAAQDCSPTVAKQTLTARNSHRQSAYIHCGTYWTVEMILKTWNFRFRCVYCVNCSIWSTLYNAYTAILSTVNGYCAIPPTYNCHCEFLSTEYSIDIAQYFSQIVQWFSHCTKNNCTRCTQYIAHTFNITSGRPITPCNNIPSPAVQ